jgi:hypothetical protein
LPQVHPIGLGTTIRRTRSAVFEFCIGPPQQADIEGAGTKEGRGRKERIEIEEEEFAVYDRVRRDRPWTKAEGRGIEDEDEESMDEGNNVRYLRMN